MLEPNYHTTMFFFSKRISYRNKKQQLFINNSVYLGLSILELSEKVMHGLWHGYIKAKYIQKTMQIQTVSLST